MKQPSTGFDGLLRRHHTEYAAQREESPARPCRRGAGPACLATPAVAVPSGHRKKKPMTDLLDYVVQAGQTLADPLLISIDLSEIAFT